jgi:hypothetical protein
MAFKRVFGWAIQGATFGQDWFGQALLHLHAFMSNIVMAH